MEETKVTESVTEKPKSLSQRLLAIMANLPYVQKKKAVSFGNTNYKAVAYEDLAAEVQPLLVKHGVLIVPSLRGLKIDMFESNGRQNMAAIVRMEFKVVNVDDPADFLVFVMPGVGYDTSDKAVGKATTYAEKDALRKLFVVPSGEEPEDDHIERTPAKAPDVSRLRAEAEAAQKAAATANPKAAAAAAQRNRLQSVSGLSHAQWSALTPDEAIKLGEATKEQLAHLWKLYKGKHASASAKDFADWLHKEIPGEKSSWIEEMWQMGAVMAGECIAKLAQ